MKKLLFLLLILILPNLASASPYYMIESEIFSLQRGIVSDIAESLQIDTMSGTRQTGSMTLSTKIDTPEASGSIMLQFSPYTITVDGKSGDSDMHYRGYVTFDMINSDYRYDQQTDAFARAPVRVTGYLEFDLSLMQVGGDIYMKLSTLRGSLSGDADMKKRFDMMLKQADKYLGKTYKIPNISNTSVEPEVVYELIQGGYSTLMSSPLFRVVSKNKDGSYRLGINNDTMKKLGLPTNRPNTKDIMSYMNTNGKKEIRISQKKLRKVNYMSVTELDGKRSFEFRAKKTQKNPEMYIFLSKKFFSFMMKDSDINIDMLWKDSTINMNISEPKGKWSQGWRMSIKGSLIDMQTMNLDIIWNEKKIGTFTSIKTGSFVSYKMNLSIAESLSRFIIDLSGNYSDVYGDYAILPPKLYELLD